ncbi:hypothetical protein GSVR_22080 [Geobacter sp. SVR]|nr:hypothetical protein GSVR_22080 [Geobacter sp. SVR]
MADVTGTLVTIAQQQSDGKLTIIRQDVRANSYESGYWKTKSDGEYELYVTQGGIRNREIPREEKEGLVRFLRPHLVRGQEGNTISTAVFKLVVFKGAITQIRVEFKSSL